MPYFHWQGIDLDGTIHSGMHFAKTQSELEKILLEQGIGLTHASRPKRLTYRPLNRQAKINFFKQCSVLLDAGVGLPKVLTLLANQSRHKQFQEALSDIARDVKEGVALSDALSGYPALFTGPMISIIQAGHESGSLGAAFGKLAHYLETVDELKKKIRSAIAMPLITFIIFLIIAMVIFIVIMPSFASILHSTGQSVPAATQKLFAFSEFLKTQSAFWWMFGIIFGFLVFRMLFKTKSGKSIGEWLIVHTPFIGSIVQQSSLTYYLQTVAMLLEGGVHLVPALQIGQNTVTNSVLAKQYQQLEEAVRHGQSMSMAMGHNPRLFSEDLIALAMVGEESSTLGSMLARAADGLHEKVLRKIRMFATVVQPALLIILGLLITGLIIAVYVPIFNLSQMVTY